MISVQEKCKTNLEKTGESMNRYYDKTRKEAPKHKVGDLVLLNSRNLKTRHPTKKLNHKLLGLFQINKVISPMTMKLSLSDSWTIHPVFHLKLLELYQQRQGQPKLELNGMLEEMEDLLKLLYEVKGVMDSSIHPSSV
jgi:hypothetical protein